MIDAMVRKLDEMQEADTANIPDYDQLRLILLAGKEEQPKELKIGGYQELALRIVEVNRRLQTIEEKLEPKHIRLPIKEKFEEFERRISELENWAVTIKSPLLYDR